MFLQQFSFGVLNSGLRDMAGAEPPNGDILMEPQYLVVAPPISPSLAELPRWPWPGSFSPV